MDGFWWIQFFRALVGRISLFSLLIPHSVIIDFVVARVLLSLFNVIVKAFDCHDSGWFRLVLSLQFTLCLCNTFFSPIILPS